MKSLKSPIIYLYPFDFELDMLYKSKYWQCAPILPYLDIENVKKAIKKVDLSKEDNKKNELIEELVF